MKLFPDTLLSELPGDIDIVDAKEDTNILQAMEQLTTGLESMNNTTFPMPNVDCGGDSSEKDCVCRTLPFVREVQDDRIVWTFYLNSVAFNQRMLNEFISLMEQTNQHDKVVIHAPAFSDDADAPAIWSAIKGSSCEDITLHSPYCLNTPATFILTAVPPGKLSTSDYMFCRITPPVVFTGGAHNDAMAGYDAQCSIYKRMYQALLQRGILTQTEYETIIKDQKQISVFGQMLKARLDNKQ